MAKYFPIKTETSCRLKWSWSTLYLNSGKTASCCIASISDLTQTNFNEFHNTPEKIKSRQEMLQGLWPTDGCKSCEDVEKTGGVSERIFQNSVPEVYPELLDQQPTAINVNPSILEVYFSNTCNLKCVYCTSSLSSAIEAENIKFGITNITQNKRNYKDLVPLFWDWFYKNSFFLKRLQVLGGEPLLQKDFFTLLDYLENNPHPNLEFNIVTNLNVPNNKVTSIAIRLANLVSSGKVKRVDIQTSIDCWGKSQEYVRHGFNHELFDANMKSLISHGVFRIGLLSTINALSIPHMESLVQKYKEWGATKEIFWYMHLVFPENGIFSPFNFDFSQFESSLNSVYNLLPNETWDQQQTRNVFGGIIEKIKRQSKTNVEMQQKLIKFLEETDFRRNLNWREYFPWLDKLDKNNVV